MPNQYEYTVCIHCMTYNHKPYILDALHGFAMQQTKFPYVALVMDDASTDGEPEVLRQYIAEQCDTSSMTTKDDELYELVEINAKDNPNCHFVFYFLRENQWHTGKKKPIINEWDAKVKYIALCEGDDYWTNPYKLQKQVDILEADNSLIGVFTNRCLVDFAGNIYEKRRNDPKYIEGRVTMRDFFAKNLQYPTASVLFRNSHVQKRIQKVEHMKNPYLGDWTLWIALHCFGDFYYLDDVTSAYRNNPTSVTHTQWVNNRVGRVKLEFDLLPRVADILPEEYADIAANLRNTNWAWLPLAKAYYKNRQYVRMMGALIVYFVKNPRNIVPLFKKVRARLLKKIKK